MPNKGHGEKPYSTMVARALEILETLDSSRRGLNISEISRKLGLPKSSTHVIVRTLEDLQYVRKAPTSLRYTLGLKAYGLGQTMMKSFAMAERALPLMQQLVATLDLTSHLAVFDENQAICVQKAEPPSLIQFDTRVGRRMDLHCTGTGKVILACSGEEILKNFLSRKSFMRHTEHTITTPLALRREIMKIRQRGYAVDDQEEELEVRCVAVPVFNREHDFAGSLSVTATTVQLPISRIPSVAKTLQETAGSIYGLRA